MDPNKPLFALAENLSAEAAAFNKKIETGGTLTLNESIAAGKKMLVKNHEIKFIDKPANKVVVGDYVSVPAYSFKVQYIKELLNEYLLISGYGQAIKVKNNKILTTYTTRGDYSIKDIRPKTIFETKPIAVKKTKSPAAKKVDFKITSYSGYFYVIHKNTGLRLINKSFRSYDDAMDSAKKLSFIATDGKPILYDTPIITKSPVVKKTAVNKPAADKKTITKKNPLRQTGSSNKKYDERVSAMKPGKRTSASGGVYYERRSNRTDKGKNL